MAKPYRLPDFKKLYPETKDEIIAVLKISERKMQYQEYDLKNEQIVIDITLNINLSTQPLILVNTHDLIMLMTSASGNSEKISIRQYPFTEVGKELSALISESVSEEDFLRYSQVLSHNKTYIISVHKVIKWNDDSVEYNRTNLIVQEGIATE